MTPAMCLALAIYFEAGTEPTVGKLATGWAIMNSATMRHNSPLCTEVFSGRYMGPNRYLHGDRPTPGKSWEISNRIAEGIISKKLHDPTGGATNFECVNSRVCKVLPSWAVGMEYRGQFGHQFFFRRH